MIFNPFGGTGGGGQTLHLVGGLTWPSGVPENTIWVKTSGSALDWIVSAAEPELVDGRIWVRIKDNLDATKISISRNLTISFRGCFVCGSGSWKPVEAKIYSGGTWRSISDGRKYYYHRGDNMEFVTGGWAGAETFGDARSYTYVQTVPQTLSHGYSVLGNDRRAALFYTAQRVRAGIVTVAGMDFSDDFALQEDGSYEKYVRIGVSRGLPQLQSYETDRSYLGDTDIISSKIFGGPDGMTAELNAEGYLFVYIHEAGGDIYSIYEEAGTNG